MFGEARHTQLALLGHDLTEIARVLDETPPFAPLADLEDPNRHARHLAVASLFTQIRYHATAVHVLLIEELYPSAIVVTRALLETWATLGYLMLHQDAQNESVIFLAASFLHRINVFSEQSALVEQLNEVLSRMPPDLVATAERRVMNHPWTWTGKTIRQMMDKSGIEGHGPLYKYLSGEAHGAIGEANVDLIPTEGDDVLQISLERRIPPKDVESLANFVRRAVHNSLGLLVDALNGPKVTLKTTDPEAWRRGGLPRRGK